MGTLYVMQGGSFVEQGGGGTGGATGTTVFHNSGSSSSMGTAVVANASTHTKTTTPIELVTSTTFNAETITVTVPDVFTANNDTATLLDIMVGGSGAETVLIANIPIGFHTAGSTFKFNVAIPSGTRISARSQSAVSAKSVLVHIGLMESGSAVAAATAVTTLGANTTTSAGITLTQPGANNSEGAWTVISASTPSDFTKLTVASTVNPSNSVGSSVGLIDIGVGAASSEVAIISNMPYATTTSENFVSYGMSAHCYLVNIPSGSRLVARYQASSNSTTASPSVVLFGMD